ncbi:molybdate ABC transporter substrate-binding protein [Novosphingobium aquimarinum]|uniref:molybdate ABC transporter substrate-binding protein n=1 Tax=Novosphingobium aquimarinum TaxID=2682494 RepID=UPI0012EBC7A0|nr:molybdate ABC transporter substrate-binding protein [Novosphingobium aquimarinum]
MQLDRRNLLIAALAGAVAACTEPAASRSVRVAVAANFTACAKEIAAAFQQERGDPAVLSFGSSGAFYAQIAQGAPFDVFLSADAAKPRQLVAEGLAPASGLFPYAIGQLALYSARAGLVDAEGDVLRTGNFARIAIADPQLAPYGQAAIEVMDRLGVRARLAPRLVRGTSIAQAFQFVSSGAADLGFVAQSQLVGATGGSRWAVPADLHSPIEQQAVLLAKASDNPAATAFVAFLKSAAARAIIARYGYGLPG